MKKAFTFALAMAMAVTGFAQVKGLSHKTVSKEAAQVQVYTGLEDINANFPASTRSILVDPEETELARPTVLPNGLNLLAVNTAP